jgi:hypothetical protein
MKSSLILAVLLTPILAIAQMDEMETSTETKLPGAIATPTAKDETPKKPLDPALRARIRKNAPFWIDDSSKGAAIRINKDGSFTSAAGGGGSIAGSWRAYKNELNISWSGGADEYSYSAKISGGKLLLEGKAIKSGRYRLSD